MNNKIVKLQLGDYFKWNNLSREDKVKRNKQIAKLYLDKGPSILNYYNALKAYFGGFNPKNPYLLGGEAPNPGMRNPKLIVSSVQTIDKFKNIFKNYNPYAYHKPKLPEIKISDKIINDAKNIKIDPNDLFTDNFIKYLENQTGRKIKRIPYKNTKDGNIYKEGFSFVDENGKEIAHIAGNLKGKNVWVESSYVDPEFRHKGLGKLMYFDFNDNVYNTYGTTLHSSALQRVGYIDGGGMSPSNRLWKRLTDDKLATTEGSGFDWWNIMANPSKIKTAYRKQGGSIKTANAAKWKHKKGGKAFVNGVNVLDSNPKAYKYVKKKIQKAEDGDKFVKAGELAKQHLLQSKAPDWSNIDYGYNSMLKAGIPHNQAIGVMANTILENRGSSKGAGIILWIENVPKGSEALWKSVIDSIVNPANTYNRQTDSMDNWWGKFGKINGKEALKRFKNPNISPSEAAEIYSVSYIRPGKPEIEKRKFFALQLDSIYNPLIKDKLIRVKKSGGLISKAQEGTKFQNLIGNVSNFLKSDSGLAMISGASQLFKTFKSSSDLAKLLEELNKWKKAYVNSIVPEDASLQVEQEEVLAKQANPDYNSSPIYKAWRLNQLELDSIQAAKQKAAQQADMYILNKLLEQLKLNNESLKNGMEDLFNKGLGMLSLYIGNKNNAPSVVTPIKDYAKEFKLNTNPSINDMKLKVALATKDPTYRLPNYTLPSISDYKFSWNK